MTSEICPICPALILLESCIPVRSCMMALIAAEGISRARKAARSLILILNRFRQTWVMPGRASEGFPLVRNQPAHSFYDKIPDRVHMEFQGCFQSGLIPVFHAFENIYMLGQGSTGHAHIKKVLA